MRKKREHGRMGAFFLLFLLNLAFGAGLYSLALTIPNQNENLDFYTPTFHNELVEEDSSEVIKPIEPSTNTEQETSTSSPTESATIRTLARKENSTRYGEYGLIQVNNRSTIPTDFHALLDRTPKLNSYQEGAPEVLIVHTHTTESFLDDGVTEYPANYSGRSQDQSKNIVAVGDVFAEALRSKGIYVMHDHTVNDFPEYSGSYKRSEWVISQYLKKYPSIRCVIDLHRDAITAADGARYKLIVPEKQDTSQVMIVSGCYKGGLAHPNYEENLRLAMRWQEQLNSKDITLAKPIDFVKYRYNQQLTTGSLILEIGTDANTLSEAKNGAVLAAKALASTLISLR